MTPTGAAAEPDPVRRSYLDAARTAQALIASDAVAAAWDAPSALAAMTVGDVAGHLGRGLITVVQYLGADPPAEDRPIVSAVAYYIEAVDINADVDSDVNRGVRQRARAESDQGHALLVDRLSAAAAELPSLLAAQPASRVVEVFGGNAMLVDDYLVTRLVELATHLDDLAVSIDVATPQLDATGRDRVIEALVGMARLRHGDLTVLRFLTRRERTSGGELHVL